MLISKSGSKVRSRAYGALVVSALALSQVAGTPQAFAQASKSKPAATPTPPGGKPSGAPSGGAPRVVVPLPGQPGGPPIPSDGPASGPDPSDLAADAAFSNINSDPTASPLGAQPGKGKGKGKDGKAKEGLDVKVDANMLVDLHVQDEELSTVLEMLSIQSQRNIIASKDVTARVTANFYGVTFREALDAILHANGFGYIEKESFIYIYTAEQIAAIQQAEKRKVVQVVKLSYLNAIDAAELVKASLSDTGQIKTPGKTTPFPSKSDVPGGNNEYVNEEVMVITDFEENIKAVVELIKQLDTRPAQVLVEATILQTSLNEANAFGVDFAVIQGIKFNDFVGVGGPLKVVDALLVNNSEKLTSPGPGDTPAMSADNSGGLVSSPGNVAGPATMKFGYIADDVGVFLRVLDEVSDTTVLSNPKVLALNRQPARVLVGQRVGYLNTTSTDTATTQTVEFLDTGTQLHFRPFVSEDGTIRMELKPQVSTAVVRDVKNSTGSVVTVPDEITNELTTNVMVRDGQTVVLGGLFRDRTKATKRQVPLLGEIPILGEAFKGHDTEVERTEIIFLITPSIVTDAALASSGNKARDAVSRVQGHSRDGMLSFSRDKRAGQLLVDATRLMEAGDPKKAMWKVEQALALNPTLPEGLSLKEKITGQKTLWIHNSILEDVIHGEADAKAPKPKAQADTPEENGFSPAAAADENSGNFWSLFTDTSVNTDTTPANVAEVEGADQSNAATTGDNTPINFAVDMGVSDPLKVADATTGNDGAMNQGEMPEGHGAIDAQTPVVDQSVPIVAEEGPSIHGWVQDFGFALGQLVGGIAINLTPAATTEQAAVTDNNPMTPEQAMAASVQTQLQTLNNQIELFCARENHYPDFETTGWAELVQGGYLKAAPVNAFNNKAGVAVGEQAVQGYGWLWNPATCQIQAITPGGLASVEHTDNR